VGHGWRPISLSRLKNNIYKTFDYFWAKYFGNFKNGQKKCPKMKIGKYFAQKGACVTIIEFYGLVTKKIFFNL